MKSFREATGITQEQLALYLDIPRTSVTRSERSERKLPKKASLKKITLFTAQLNEPATPPDQVVEADAKAATAFSKRNKRQLFKCQNQLIKAQQQLESQQKTHAQCCSAVHLVNAMLPTITTDDRTARKDINWFKSREYESLKKIKHCGPAAQRQTQSTIRRLQMEIKELQDLLESDNGNA